MAASFLALVLTQVAPRLAPLAAAIASVAVLQGRDRQLLDLEPELSARNPLQRLRALTSFFALLGSILGSALFREALTEQGREEAEVQVQARQDLQDQVVAATREAELPTFDALEGARAWRNAVVALLSEPLLTPGALAPLLEHLVG